MRNTRMLYVQLCLWIICLYCGVTVHSKPLDESSQTNPNTDSSRRKTIVSIADGDDFPIYRQWTEGHSQRGWYSNAAVATDSEECSQVGAAILKRNGSVVDAGIAAMFCNSVHDQAHMGLGGGSVFLIYASPNTGGPKELVALDGNVRFPQWLAGADQEKFGERLSDTVGVPGEVAGYYQAWQRYGLLPWKQLIVPAINYARNGFRVSQIMAKTSASELYALMYRPGMRMFTLPCGEGKDVGEDDWSSVCPLDAGTMLTDPKLADTLETIAEEGGETFYTGTLSKIMLQDMQDTGIEITDQDLANFKVNQVEIVSTTINRGKYTVQAPGQPFFGRVMMFILNVMEAFGMEQQELKTKEGIALFYHRYMETWKFAYAFNKCIGSTADHVQGCKDMLDQMLSTESAAEVASLIQDDQVLQDEEYDYFNTKNMNGNGEVQDHGTSHFSIIGSDGSAFSATSTVSLPFGSQIKGSRTGIIFNNQLVAYPADSIDFKKKSTAKDTIPGYASFTLRTPIIVKDSDDNVVLVIGTSGGIRIPSGLALEIYLHLVYNLDLQHSIDYPQIVQGSKDDRLVFRRDHMDQEVLKMLEERGQQLFLYDELEPKKGYTCVTQGVSKVKCRQGDIEPCIEAVSDYRKGGIPDGY